MHNPIAEEPRSAPAHTPHRIPTGASCAYETPYEVLPGVFCIRADNASTMAFEGTNTWVLHSAEASACAVIDPGTAKSRHLDALRAFARSKNSAIEAVVVTHAHIDHVSGARELAEACKAPLLMREEATLPDGPLRLFGGLLDAEVVSLPGHSFDSVGIVLVREKAIVSGDLFFSRGWSIVPHPNGSLARYLESLACVRSMLESGRVETVLPGHREIMTASAAIARIDEYASHRRRRLEDVRLAAHRLGTFDVDAIVADVYSEIDDSMLLEGARMSVASQIAYLEETKERFPKPPDA